VNNLQDLMGVRRTHIQSPDMHHTPLDSVIMWYLCGGWPQQRIVLQGCQGMLCLRPPRERAIGLGPPQYP
jgi:hypothetical protein